MTAYLNWDGSGTPPPDPAPAAPTGVQASDGLYTTKVAVGWTASASATAYEVWRSTTAVSASATLLGTSVTTTLDDTTAVAGTTYHYWVKAKSGNGTSGFSASDTGFRATTPPPAPGAPTGVLASDGTFTTKVLVTWGVSSGATGYEVWRNSSNSSGTAVLQASPVGRSYDDTSAVPGTTYFYWVKAMNATGTSGFSAADSGFAATTPPPSGPFDANGNTTAYGIPSGTVGNIASGTTVWSNKCASCHPAPFGAVGAFTYPALSSKLSSSSLMSGISLTVKDKADLTAYLNRGDAVAR